MFLSPVCDDIPADCILRKAKVLSLEEYGRDGEADDDMFICDYEYDFHWKRFYRRTEWDEGADLFTYSDEESDDEEGDATFTIADILNASSVFNNKEEKEEVSRWK